MEGSEKGRVVAVGEIGNHSRDLQKGEWVRHGWEKDCAEPNGPKEMEGGIDMPTHNRVTHKGRASQQRAVLYCGL